MAYLKSSQITGLSAKDVDVRGFTQAETLKLGDRAYTKHEVLLADNYSVVGNVTVTDDLIISKLSDDGNAITITGDTTTREISGSGSIQGATLAQTPNATLTGMTGELGSVVTGSPSLNLTTGTTLGSGVIYPSGHIIQTVSARPASYSSTTGYSSASLVPCAQQSITARGSNSTFLIHWNAEYGRNVSGRSQWAIGTTYTPGTSSYDAGYFFYSHYAHYTSADQRLMTSYSYHDKSQTLAVGASVTYYIWLGVIGSATDTAEHQEIQIQELAA